MSRQNIIEPRKMITFRRLVFYLVMWMFFVGLTAIISAEGLFIKIDEAFYNKYYVDKDSDKEEPYREDVIIIDIPKRYEHANLTTSETRLKTARLLAPN